MTSTPPTADDAADAEVAATPAEATMAGPAFAESAFAGPASAEAASAEATPAEATSAEATTADATLGHPMQRVCFQLQVKPERLAEYRERHASVWPDMLAALKSTGWNNYSLFVRDDGLLVGYFETPSLEAAQAGMAETEVNARWQSEMGEFFVDLDLPPDEGFLRLTEVFHLEDQLAVH